MKQVMKTFSVALMGLAMGSGAFAQTAYKGQLYVNNEKFCLQGEVLRVQLRVSYDDDILNSGGNAQLHSGSEKWKQDQGAFFCRGQRQGT